MRFFTCLLLALLVSGCKSQHSGDIESSAVGTVNSFSDMQVVTIAGFHSFIRWPGGKVGSTTKWVWYAPTFLLRPGMGPTPMPQQVGYYFDELEAAGIAVVGVDVDESFGSPEGRQVFEQFYQYMQGQGMDEQGCMILQSRGGLMGYNWIMDYPGRVKCVAGIYPLLTVTDYVGLDYMANVWGVTSAWLQANLSTQSPLERDQALQGVNVFHLHGDSDNVVHYQNDQTFVSHLASGQFTLVPGEGHEFYSPEFFHNDALLNFLKENLR